MAAHLSYVGELKGHAGAVTSIATSPENTDMIVTGSRDRTAMLWDVTRTAETIGRPTRSLHGHSHFVQDVVISSDAQFALSGSWDGTLRLWDLATGSTTRRFVGHTKDVLSVAFSPDNRQIVSASRDKTIKLWNVLGECKHTIKDNMHTEWVSCVRFCPQQQTRPLIVSGGWDKMVKVWNLHNCTLLHDLKGHTGYVNTVTVSPDGSLCASGGKEGVAMLWDLTEGKMLYSLPTPANEEIYSLEFSPNRYWLCAATSGGVKIWDLESKAPVEVPAFEEKFPSGFYTSKRKHFSKPFPISLSWSANGSTLYAGYTDGAVRVWQVNVTD